VSFAGKARGWLARYGPAEVVGTLTAVGGSFAAYHATGSEVASAYGGAVGENVGFYGTILLREFLTDRRAGRRTTRTFMGLLFEFGPAEVLDSLVIRPLAMGLATQALGGRGVGVIVGKLLADVTFYLPVILSYELRQTLARRRGRNNPSDS
jgi:hypothetical protein